MKAENQTQVTPNELQTKTTPSKSLNKEENGKISSIAEMFLQGDRREEELMEELMNKRQALRNKAET